MKGNRYINIFSARREEIFLILILILALILRTRTIDYLIEYFITWDEIVVGYPAKRIVLTGDLNPHFFMYPSFHIYLISFLIYLAQTICLGIKDSSLLLLGRAASVLFGCATIIVVYLIGKELFNKIVGLIAALFISLNSSHLYLSQVIKPDASVIFWVTISFLFAVKIMLRGQRRDYLLSGIFCGIATSVKYNLFPIIPAIIAHFLQILARKERFILTFKVKDEKFILLLLSSVFIFLITSPYIILDFKTAVSHVETLYLAGQLGSGFRISTEGWLHWRYIYTLFITYPHMVGFPLIIFSIGGIFLLMVKDRRKAMLLLSYPVSFFIFACSITINSYEHEHSTMIPFLCILGSTFIGELLLNKERVIRAIGYLSLFLVITFSSLSTSRSGCNLVTYHDAEEWIKDNIPHQSKIAYYLTLAKLNESNFIIVTPPGSPSELSRDFLIDKDPDYILIGRHYFSNILWVSQAFPADTLNALLSGKLGYKMVKTFEGGYFLEEFYTSLAPEFISDNIKILKRMK